MNGYVILGSQSPARYALLQALVPANAIRVVPPRDPEEMEFEGLHDLESIERRVALIAQHKHEDVVGQFEAWPPAEQKQCRAILTADTVIIGTDKTGEHVVCGKPPGDREQAERIVRDWFTNLYAGQVHFAKTALCVSLPRGDLLQMVVTTRVQFHPDSPTLVDWYLATGEPFGKAGGYAIQGAGSLFVQAIEGSASNIGGLPLWELRSLLETLDILPLPQHET